MMIYSYFAKQQPQLNNLEGKKRFLNTIIIFHQYSKKIVAQLLRIIFAWRFVAKILANILISSSQLCSSGWHKNDYNNT